MLTSDTPLLRRALDTVDAGRGAHRALDGLRDRLLDVRRSRARIEGGHADDRHGDVGKQVDRKPAHRYPAEHQDISDTIKMRTGLRRASRVSHMLSTPSVSCRAGCARPRGGGLHVGLRAAERIDVARDADRRAVREPVGARDDDLFAAVSALRDFEELSRRRRRLRGARTAADTLVSFKTNTYFWFSVI